MDRACCLVLASLAAGSLAVGDPIAATDQVREIGVSAEYDTGEEVLSDSDFDAAPGFGAFSSDVAAQVGLVIGVDDVTALSGQDSDITSTGMSGTAYAYAEAPGVFGVPLGDAGSTFYAEFTVPAAIDFSLTGSLTVMRAAAASAAASVSLDGPGGNIYFDSLSDDGVNGIAAAGTLGPGTYTLTFGASATVTETGDTASGEWDFELTFVPEPSSLAALALVSLLAPGVRRGMR